MTDTKKRPQGRQVGTLFALSNFDHFKLMQELKHLYGPVNLSAIAKRYDISRGTLLKYIKEEPGLEEAIKAKRDANGRGYVPVKRGTRVTRANSKVRSEAIQPPPPTPEQPHAVRDLLLRNATRYLDSSLAIRRMTDEPDDEQHRQYRLAQQQQAIAEIKRGRVVNTVAQRPKREIQVLRRPTRPPKP